MKRFLAILLLSCAVLVTDRALAQESVTPQEPPVRLKKKKKDRAEKPEPEKPEPEKPDPLPPL